MTKRATREGLIGLAIFLVTVAALLGIVAFWKVFAKPAPNLILRDVPDGAVCLVRKHEGVVVLECSFTPKPARQTL